MAKSSRKPERSRPGAGSRKSAGSRPSAEQLRARREYVTSTGYRFTKEELAKVAEQWRKA